MKAALLALLLPVALWAEPLSYHVSVMTTSETGEELFINWCTPPGQSLEDWSHEVQVLEFPAKENQLPVYEKQVQGGTSTWAFTPVRAGVYYVRARSCNAAGECSPWNLSFKQEDDIVVCSVTPQRVLWYVKLAAPTGGGIE